MEQEKSIITPKIGLLAMTCALNNLSDQDARLLSGLNIVADREWNTVDSETLERAIAYVGGGSAEALESIGFGVRFEGGFMINPEFGFTVEDEDALFDEDDNQVFPEDRFSELFDKYTSLGGVTALTEEVQAKYDKAMQYQEEHGIK